MQLHWTAFTLPLQRTLEGIISFLPRIMVAAVLFFLFYVLANIVRKITRQSLEKIPTIPWAARILIARLAYIAGVLMALLIALSAIDVNVTTVLTSLGVAGFALGFALKDILENFISGILLLFSRPFALGDQVKLGEFEGSVADIQIRTTSLRTYGGEIVIIPNSKVYTSAVINYTTLGMRRYRVQFDTALSADTRAVEATALAAAANIANVAEEPAPAIRITGIDTSIDCIHWEVFFWGPPQKASEVAMRSEYLTAIKTAIFDAGTPTPLATTTTILRRENTE